MPEQQHVTEMFNDIAPHYDFLNHFLSFNIDKIWRRKTARFIAQYKPTNILDLATGTADLAILLAKRNPKSQITGLDLSEKMLQIGKQKIKAKQLEQQITLNQGDACNLPFADNSFDAITVAFGVRNFHDLKKGLNEMQRVVKYGGHIAILEFSTPTKPFFKTIYNFYFHKILPIIGKTVSKNDSAYSYLPESVSTFPSPDTFINIMQKFGLICEQKSILSGGIATLYCIVKQ